jgi:predicted nucleic acid-binding protein
VDDERIIGVGDTSFVVASLNRRDHFHGAARALIKRATTILMPQTVLTEVAYLIQQRIGSAAVADFLELLGSSKFEPLPLTTQDFHKTASILRQYSDCRIDFVDASVMAVAERLGIETILTLDRRDFSIYRPKHTSYFTLLPE